MLQSNCTSFQRKAQAFICLSLTRATNVQEREKCQLQARADFFPLLYRFCCSMTSFARASHRVSSHLFFSILLLRLKVSPLFLRRRVCATRAKNPTYRLPDAPHNSQRLRRTESIRLLLVVYYHHLPDRCGMKQFATSLSFSPASTLAPKAYKFLHGAKHPQLSPCRFSKRQV